MLAFSSVLVVGENTTGMVGTGQVVDDIDADEPSNIASLLAFECTQAAVQRLCLKFVVPKNIRFISSTPDTSHFDRSPLNDVAPRNVPRMFFTLDTSHLEMSLSNNLARANMRLMSVTRDTSQVPIGPCGPLKHLPFGDSLRHASTALLSCTRDAGENAGVGDESGLAGVRSNYGVK